MSLLVHDNKRESEKPVRNHNKKTIFTRKICWQKKLQTKILFNLFFIEKNDRQKNLSQEEFFLPKKIIKKHNKIVLNKKKCFFLYSLVSSFTQNKTAKYIFSKKKFLTKKHIKKIILIIFNNIKNSKCNLGTKINNSKCDKTQKQQFSLNLKNFIVTTQKLYFWQLLNWKLWEKKSRISETKHLSTDADSRTNAIGGWTKNTPKPDFFLKTEKIIPKQKNSKTSRDMPKLAIRPLTRGL